MHFCGNVRSFVIGDTSVATGPSEFQVGPIPAGSVIRRILWAFSSSAVTRVTFGASVSTSNDTTQTNYASGISLISPGGATLNGRPALTVVLASGAGVNVVMPVGLRVIPGPAFVIFSWAASSGDVAEIVVGVEVGLSLVKGREGLPREASS